MGYETELSRALSWLDETDRIGLEHFSIGMDYERKPDGSPVTVADRAIERALREAVARDFAGDVVSGEEEGSEAPAAGGGARRWIVDPIDATRNYRRGVPVFATLLALEHDGALVLGAVSAPALRMRWWAVRGGGAFRDGSPIRVSSVADLAVAELASGGVDGIAAAGRLDGFVSLARRAERHRGWGDFWGHMLVAQGSVEAMVDPHGLSEWDLAAPKVIVEEAGGRMTTLDGEDRIDEGTALSTNGVLHEAVLAALRA